jgi:long-chain acyl-CoA synthetase
MIKLEVFGLFKSANSSNFYKDIVEVFETGLSLSKDESCLGHRPIVSRNPLKFANHYVWLTYAEVDTRRRAIGSAIHGWFTDGTLVGGELETVGIWSVNRPGKILCIDAAGNQDCSRRKKNGK